MLTAFLVFTSVLFTLNTMFLAQRGEHGGYVIATTGLAIWSIGLLFAQLGWI